LTPENDEQILRLLHSVLLEVRYLHRRFLTTDQRERRENVMPELWTCILYQRINTQHAPRTPRNRLTLFPILYRSKTNRYPIHPHMGKYGNVISPKFIVSLSISPPNHNDPLVTIIIHKVKILADAPHSYSSLMQTTNIKFQKLQRS
jgi:hypothetical protein